MSKPAILCVDDEAVVLASLKIQLKQLHKPWDGKELIETIKSGLAKL